MPTRIYLPASSAAPAISPAVGAGWTATATTGFVRINGVTVKSATTLADHTSASPSGTNPSTQVMRQYIIGPMAAQTVSGSITGVIRGLESNANLNSTVAICIRQVNSAGTHVADILSVSASDNTAAAPPEFTTSASTRLWNDVNESSTVALTSRTLTAGDYIVIEIGFRKAGTSTSFTTTLRFGDSAASDFALTDGLTTDLNPWVEFNGTLNFQRTRDSLSRFRVRASTWRDTAAARLRLRSAVRVRDSVARFKLNPPPVTTYRDTIARIRIQAAARAQVAWVEVLSPLAALRDTSARFNLLGAAQNWRNTVTRFNIGTAASYRFSSFRSRIAAGTWRNTNARFRLYQTAFRDTLSRYRLASTSQWRHTVARVRVNAQQWRDTAARFRVQTVGGATRDSAWRFRLGAIAFRDSVQRFRVGTANQFRDSNARARVAIAAWRDSTARFRLLRVRDSAWRARIAIGRYVDTATRTRVRIQAFTNAAVRFRLNVIRDSVWRMRIGAQLYRDTVARFRVQTVGGAWRDSTARLRLASVATWRNIAAARFQLGRASFRDLASARLRLASAFTIRDSATRQRLRSVALYRDTVTRIAFAFAGTRDTAARFKVLGAGVWRDAAWRYRLVTAAVWRDTATTRARIGAGPLWRHTVARTRVSAARWTDTASRVRLLSSGVWRDLAGGRALVSARVWTNVPILYRLRAMRLRDTVWRVNQRSVNIFRDARVRFSMGTPTFRDTAWRFGLVGVGAGTVRFAVNERPRVFEGGSRSRTFKVRGPGDARQ